MLDVSNPCPHSRMKRLDAEGWIKLRWKHNAEVKSKCAMQNEWIDGLIINHSLSALLEQEWMWVLNVKEMEYQDRLKGMCLGGSSSKMIVDLGCRSLPNSKTKSASP